jgi:hypothetical protein
MPDIVICAHCSEPVLENEPRMPFNGGTVIMHRNCGLRGILGSLAHVQGRCGCYVPGSHESDPEGMTLRQAADAAVAEWRRIESLRLHFNAALPACGNGKAAAGS